MSLARSKTPKRMCSMMNSEEMIKCVASERSSFTDEDDLDLLSLAGAAAAAALAQHRTSGD